MKDKDFKNIAEFTNVGGGLIPHNEKAKELVEQSSRGEILSFEEVTARDLSFHRCYFALLNFIYNLLPQKFKDAVPEHKFYIFLKHLRGSYEVLFEFKDGTRLVEYDSIAFGKMSQKSFENYIREQLPWIYENVIGVYYQGDIYNGIIDTIEEEFERFMMRL
jgi:hypothetical protein